MTKERANRMMDFECVTTNWKLPFNEPLGRRKRRSQEDDDNEEEELTSHKDLSA